MTVMVKNRTVYIDPPSGMVQSIFTARNLWSWPQVIVDLNCRPLWQEGLDEQVYIDAFQEAIEHIDAIMDKIIQARISYAMVEEMDFEPLRKTGRDIWYWSAPDGSIFMQRLQSIIIYCEQQAKHPEHNFLLGHTFEIVHRAASAYPMVMLDFWKMVKRIWPIYSSDPSPLAGIHLGGLTAPELQRMFDNNKLPNV